MSAFPAITTDAAELRRHVGSGGRAAYRFLTDGPPGVLAREIFRDPLGVLSAGSWDWVSGEWLNEPLPDLEPGRSVWVLLGEHDIGVDPAGRWTRPGAY